MGIKGVVDAVELSMSGKIPAFHQQFRIVVVSTSCQARSARCIACS